MDDSPDQCPGCRRLHTVLDGGRAAGHYEGALRAIIHAFKYEGRRQLAKPLSNLLLDAGTPVLTGADYLIPVPLHPLRRVQRGFNQAEDLASRLGLPVRRTIRRIRATPPQSTLDAHARRRNVYEAFALSPRMTPRLRRQWLDDRSVVLVDDVRTTGATLEACACLLKSAGVREVRALTIARADLGPTNERSTAQRHLPARARR